MEFKQVVKSLMPTSKGKLNLYGFEMLESGKGPVALAKGILGKNTIPLVRIHSQCLTGEAFHSLRCDCGEQLDLALERIVTSGCGLVIYLFQEGRGIGIMNKIRAYSLQDEGLDTVEANHVLGYQPDPRSYSLAASVLEYFGIERVRLLSNNPDKAIQLTAAGIEVVATLPLVIPPNAHSFAYLNTKRDKMGHLLS